MMNFISFAASGRATNSALLDDKVTLRWLLDFQQISTPSRKIQKP